MGLGSLLHRVISRVAPEFVLPLVKNVFLTGGCSSIPGFSDRLRYELIPSSPFQAEVSVYSAQDGVVDPWKGAQRFSNSAFFEKSLITRSQYDEMGHSYLNEHFCSNFYHIPPTSIADFSNDVPMSSSPAEELFPPPKIQRGKKQKK